MGSGLRSGLSGDQFGTSGRDSRSGAVLNCWGGEWWVFLVIATKVNLFYNGVDQVTGGGLPEASEADRARHYRLRGRAYVRTQGRGRWRLGRTSQGEAFGDYRQRRVVEHRLARLAIRQSRYFERAKTKFQLYLAATASS